MSDDRSNPDWINLPAGVEATSLWCSLHDGDLTTIRSDRLARTMSLEVDVPHLRDHHGLAEGPFTIELEQVQAARVTTWEIWPGPSPDTRGMTRAEESSLIEEYQSRWREESVGWDDFEAMFAGGSLDIGNADAVLGDRVISLRASGMMSGDQVGDRAIEFTIRAAFLAIRHGKNHRIGFDRFVLLGQEYWKAFSELKRSQTGSLEG